MKRSNQWDGIGNPLNCKSCLPDILESNREAWMVYQYSFDSMGFSMLVADRMCDRFKVDDPEECLLKIKELRNEISEIEEKGNKGKTNPMKDIIQGWG